MTAMLEPGMVAARIQGPTVIAGRSHEPARITAVSQGGFAIVAIVHSPPGAGSLAPCADGEKLRCGIHLTGLRAWKLEAMSENNLQSAPFPTLDPAQISELARCTDARPKWFHDAPTLFSVGPQSIY